MPELQCNQLLLNLIVAHALVRAASRLVSTLACNRYQFRGKRRDDSRRRTHECVRHIRILELVYLVAFCFQKPLRFDQDLSFGSDDLKEAFFTIKLLTDHQVKRQLRILHHTRRNPGSEIRARMPAQRAVVPPGEYMLFVVAPGSNGPAPSTSLPVTVPADRCGA